MSATSSPCVIAPVSTSPAPIHSVITTAMLTTTDASGLSRQDMTAAPVAALR